MKSINIVNLRIISIITKLSPIISVVFSILMLFGMAESQTVLSEKSKYSNHMNTLTFLSDREKTQRSNQYLESLNDKDYFALINDITMEKVISKEGRLVVGHLRRRWADNPPVDPILQEIANKQNNSDYRNIMVDYLAHFSKKKARQEYVQKKTNVDIKKVALKYKDIVADKSDDVYIREKTLIVLSKLTGILWESKAFNAKEMKSYGDFYLDLLNTESANVEIISGAIKGLHSINDERLLPVMRAFMNNSNTTGVPLIRLAVITSAMMKDPASLTIISRLMEVTDNKDVFRTCVYALCLYKNPSTFKVILRNRNKFDVNIARSILRGARATVEKVIVDSDRANLRDAIDVIKFAELKETKKYLHTLVNDSDRNVRFAVIQTLMDLGEKEDLLSVLDAARNETDTEILGLLRQVDTESKRVLLQPEASLEPTERSGGAK